MGRLHHYKKKLPPLRIFSGAATAIECGKCTVIAFFNHCLSLIAYDLRIEQYCNSGNNSSGTVTSMFAFYRLYYRTIRDSEKSASQNKLNNLNKLSAKLRIHFLIQAYNLI